MALVVFTGGARSGKSAAAQQLAQQRALDGQPVTVAVFGREDDPEMADRIARHRAQRPSGFSTVEAHSDEQWLERVDDAELLLVDCLGTLLASCMERAWEQTAAEDAPGDTLTPQFAQAAQRDFDAALERLLARGGDTIVVTNEVGSGVVPAYASGRLFRDLLGSANRRLVEESDAAYLCTAGRLLDLRKLPSRAAWPVD